MIEKEESLGSIRAKLNQSIDKANNVDSHKASIEDHGDLDLTGASEGDIVQRSGGKFIRRTLAQVAGPFLRLFGIETSYQVQVDADGGKVNDSVKLFDYFMNWADKWKPSSFLAAWAGMKTSPSGGRTVIDKM